MREGRKTGEKEWGRYREPPVTRTLRLWRVYGIVRFGLWTFVFRNGEGGGWRMWRSICKVGLRETPLFLVSSGSRDLFDVGE